MTRLTDQYKSTIHQLVREVIDLNRWRRNVTGDSPLFDIANEHTPTTLSADQDDYDPGYYDVLRVNATADISITGITKGKKGRFLEFYNVSDYKITFPNESTSSTAANRIINSSGENIVVFSTGRVRMYYDSTLARWVIPDPPSWGGTYGMGTRLQITSVPADSRQTIPTGAFTKILLDTINPVIGDEWGFFDAANNQIVIPTGLGGLYTGMFSAIWSPAGGSVRMTTFNSFGTIRGTTTPVVAGLTMFTIIPVSGPFVAGDSISFTAFQDSGAPLDLYNIAVDFGRVR